MGKVNPLALLTNRIYSIVVTALLVLAVGSCSIQTVRIEGLKVWPLEIQGYAEKVQTLKDAIGTMIAAQGAAFDAQKTLNDEKDRAYVDLARKADAAARTYRDRLRRAADDYARTHACRMPGETAGLSSGGTGAAGADNAPPGGDGSGEGPEMVAVTRPEFDEFVEWGHRLQIINGWGDELIEKKLAVPLPEPTFGNDTP